MKRYNVSALSNLFSVLSDGTRLKLLILLQTQGELHVSELCKQLRLPQPTVSHHLGLLRVHGLVKNRRAGKQVFYSIDKTRYGRISAAACKLLAAG